MEMSWKDTSKTKFLIRHNKYEHNSKLWRAIVRSKNFSFRCWKFRLSQYVSKSVFLIKFIEAYPNWHIRLTFAFRLEWKSQIVSSDRDHTFCESATFFPSSDKHAAYFLSPAKSSLIAVRSRSLTALGWLISCPNNISAKDKHHIIGR